MIKIKYIVLTCFVIVILTGFFLFTRIPFGPGIYDFTKEVTGDYVLYRTSSNSVFIAPEDGWNDKIPTIPEKVIRLNDYNDFIIAERQELKPRKLDRNDSYMIPDESKISYCILDTDKKYVLKNLNKNQFKRKLDSLGIPNQIELIDIYEY